MPVSFAPQDMGRICVDAADEVRASYPDARIDLRLAGELQGRRDGSRLGQLMVNLLTNAVRYGSGPIVVEAKGQDGKVTVVVSNQGDPIPEHALPTLFDPLTRASSPNRSGTAAGIGLGLYICRCITTAHQGTISVESSEQGTRFTVHLPRSPA
jgi:signal transduction histidine kinase